MALLKVSLVVFSSVFWVAGLGMFTVGIWAKISLGHYLVLSAHGYPNTPFILLAAGGVVLFWGFLGCFSAATENKRLLRTYGIFQAAVLAAGLAAGLSGLFYHRDIAEGLQRGLSRAIELYGEDEQKANAINSMQRSLDCCGVHSYRDWYPSPWPGEPWANGSVPLSCCTVRKGCDHNPVSPGAPGIHRPGCFSKIHQFVSDNVFHITAGALGSALAQTISIVLACALAARLPPAGGPQR
ncbi:tetraspanin-7-like [Callorhinchus milii]|uniref:tetraspanin-7-like n=1 Tax=Callorhinchus milii TaxID=7868 RepID=UPI001C3FC6AF|nr:tetraspanin-7-like [Callorhinchus milii]